MMINIKPQEYILCSMSGHAMAKVSSISQSVSSKEQNVKGPPAKTLNTTQFPQAKFNSKSGKKPASFNVIYIYIYTAHM